MIHYDFNLILEQGLKGHIGVGFHILYQYQSAQGDIYNLARQVKLQILYKF